MRSEALKKAQRKYRENNRDKFKEYTYKYRKNNKQKILDIAKKSYENNKEKCKERYFNKRNYKGDPIMSIRNIFRDS